MLNDLFLAQGYAVASSSLNVLDNNCSPIISAEAAMMVKEHFIETYGPVAAHHRLGRLGRRDPAVRHRRRPTRASSTASCRASRSPTRSPPLGPVTDCRLLDTLLRRRRRRVHRRAAAARSPASRLRHLPVLGRDVRQPDHGDRTAATRPSRSTVRWDPVTNPDGVKCSADEQFVNQLGRDPRTGFVAQRAGQRRRAVRPAALNDGHDHRRSSSPTLNAGIGGFDYTGEPVAQRTAADPRALRARPTPTTWSTAASQGLRTTPIIDQRTDLDFAGFGNDIHTTEWSFVMRARMTEAGTVGNQVIIENATPPRSAAASVYELAAMDQWLTAIDADTSHRPLSAKVVGRPAALDHRRLLSSTTAPWCTRRCPYTGVRAVRERVPGRLEHPVGGRRDAVHAGR